MLMRNVPSVLSVALASCICFSTAITSHGTSHDECVAETAGGGQSRPKANTTDGKLALPEEETLPAVMSTCLKDTALESGIELKSSNCDKIITTSTSNALDVRSDCR